MPLDGSFKFAIFYILYSNCLYLRTVTGIGTEKLKKCKNIYQEPFLLLLECHAYKNQRPLFRASKY